MTISHLPDKSTIGQPSRLISLEAAATDLPPLPEPGLVHGFGLNENPYPVSPEVVTAVLEATMGGNRYPDPAHYDLVAALTAILPVDPEQLSVGPGLVAICRALVQAVAGVGDEVMFPWPSFDDYLIDAILHDTSPVSVPLHGNHIDLDAMFGRITPRTRLIFLASPNNPTGTTVADADLERFLAALPAGVVVALDEAYAEFATAPDRADGLRLSRVHSNLVVLRTFSKAYGLAGFRVGYAVSEPGLASRMNQVLAPFGVSRPAQAAAVAALRHQEVTDVRVRELIAERDGLTAALRMSGWRLPDSQGNFLWLPVRDRAVELAAQLAADEIAVRPFPGHGVRITVGLRSDSKLLLAALAKARRAQLSLRYA
ncbi:aminotransferase class I/II-fold pyridoxal phosphate-dependent enzyme [Amycolatopsis sp. NBC_00345]|uniref:aminotransferase class I/II-fold pyridoxal phosphate-dependent enzyme n=1 Tax=Amycolatopsis sp. NBC_00345 TaxID=2975955 RepID=UPI002E2681E8